MKYILIICMTRRGGLLQFSDCLVKNLAQLCPVAVVTAKNAEHSEPDWDQNTISGFILDMGEGKEGTFQKLFLGYPDSHLLRSTFQACQRSN